MKVTNWREADLVELQVVESGSAKWKKVLGPPLKAGQWTWAKVPQEPRIVSWICGGKYVPTVSRRMCPISISGADKSVDLVNCLRFPRFGFGPSAALARS